MVVHDEDYAVADDDDADDADTDTVRFALNSNGRWLLDCAILLSSRCPVAGSIVFCAK